MYTIMTGSNPPTLMLGGTEAFHFSIFIELEQIIIHPTCVPDRHGHAANTLDLFFTSNPQNYVSSPLRSSVHCTVTVTSSFTPPPLIPPTQRHLWLLENSRCADMSNFLLDFPRNLCSAKVCRAPFIFP